MTTFLAVVKYAVDDPPEKKVEQLSEGLQMIAMELIECHGCEMAQVQDWLDDAAAAAEWSAAARLS